MRDKSEAAAKIGELHKTVIEQNEELRDLKVRIYPRINKCLSKIDA